MARCGEIDEGTFQSLLSTSILAQTCSNFKGERKHKKSKLNCPRCGILQKKPQIFSRVNDSNTLHRVVSELNITEELRNDFKKLIKLHSFLHQSCAKLI